MIVVADGVGIGERREVGHIPGSHVVEAHRNRTLKGRLVGEWQRWRRILQSPADGNSYPWDQIGGAPARIGTGDAGGTAVDLLPHLVEAMDGIAHRIRVLQVLGNRKRAIWQISGKPFVGDEIELRENAAVVQQLLVARSERARS